MSNDSVNDFVESLRQVRSPSEIFLKVNSNTRNEVYMSTFIVDDNVAHIKFFVCLGLFDEDC